MRILLRTNKLTPVAAAGNGDGAQDEEKNGTSDGESLKDDVSFEPPSPRAKVARDENGGWGGDKRCN